MRKRERGICAPKVARTTGREVEWAPGASPSATRAARSTTPPALTLE